MRQWGQNEVRMRRGRGSKLKASLVWCVNVCSAVTTAIFKALGRVVYYPMLAGFLTSIKKGGRLVQLVLTSLFPFFAVVLWDRDKAYRLTMLSSIRSATRMASLVPARLLNRQMASMAVWNERFVLILLPPLPRILASLWLTHTLISLTVIKLLYCLLNCFIILSLNFDLSTWILNI